MGLFRLNASLYALVYAETFFPRGARAALTAPTVVPSTKVRTASGEKPVAMDVGTRIASARPRI